MPRTSNKAEEIMDYVNQFIQENGYSPSVREIGAAALRDRGASGMAGLCFLRKRSHPRRTGCAA